MEPEYPLRTGGLSMIANLHSSLSTARTDTQNTELGVVLDTTSMTLESKKTFLNTIVTIMFLI